MCEFDIISLTFFLIKIGGNYVTFSKEDLFEEEIMEKNRE